MTAIAVNGVCLTALDVTPGSFAAEVSPETLLRTTLGGLLIGSPVNLERALLPTTRLGGHIVQGHVDGRGIFVSAVPQGDFWTVTVAFPLELARYFVEKGSVAVEGISRNPQASNKIFTPMILGLALIESLVIYGLVIAFLLYGKIG